MKKLILTTVLCASLGVAHAQLPLENFNGPGMPSGWTMIKVDNNTVNSSAFAAPIPTVLTAQAWMKRLRATGDSAMLTVSNFSPPGTSDRWLITPSFSVNSANMVIQWEDWESAGAAYNDSVQIWVSTTGGTTPASFTSKIYDAPASPDATPYGIHAASLSAFNGQTVRVAFRSNCTQQGALRLDNVQTLTLAVAKDAGVQDIEFPNIVASTGSFPVGAVIKNNGAQNITSIELSYKVDGGAAINQTFTGMALSPLATTTLHFSAPISNPSAGAHNITVNILNVNGSPDNFAANDQSTRAFAVATGTTPRNGLIEEFTSSTCAPCASFNSWWDPLTNSPANKANDPNSRFNVIKYQMNWPSPGNDVSYNPDGAGRRGFYGVNAVPDHYTNGQPGIPLGSPQSAYQTEIDNSKAAPAYVSLSGTYTIKGDSLIASVTVTPNFTLPSAPYKLYMAATQAHYQNPGNTTGQLDYYHVMRKMLPDFNGIPVGSLTAGVPQTFTQKYKFTVGGVAQGNYNFWTSPFSGNLIAFVQEPATGEIMQSVSIPAQWPTAINQVAEMVSGVQLFPNPVKNSAHLVFNLQKATDVKIVITDVSGKVVYTQAGEMGNGQQRVSLDASGLAAGVYQLTVHAGSQSESVKMNVIR